MDASAEYYRIVRAGTVLADTAFAVGTEMRKNLIEVEEAVGRRYMGVLDGTSHHGNIQVSVVQGNAVLLLVGPNRTGLVECITIDQLNDELVADFARRGLEAVKSGVALKDSIPA